MMKECVITTVKNNQKLFSFIFRKNRNFVKNACIETIKTLKTPEEKNLHVGNFLNFCITGRKLGSNYVICANYQEPTTRNREMVHNFTKKLNSHIKSIGNP